MTVTGSILRLAGTTLLVVAVAACGGLDRSGPGAATSSGADGDPVGPTSVGGLGADLGADAADADEALVAELDALLAEAGQIDPDFDPGLDDVADVAGPEPSATSTGPGATAPALPPFEAGSFAALDAALSTLDFALGAGEAGSEGNLP